MLWTVSQILIWNHCNVNAMTVQHWYVEHLIESASALQNICFLLVFLYINHSCCFVFVLFFPIFYKIYIYVEDYGINHM